MMKYEFEKIAGYEVSQEDYDNIIEPMYMAVELTKTEFVKCIDKKRFALRTEKQLVNEMKKLAKHLKEICENYTDYDALSQLGDLALEYARRFCASGTAPIYKNEYTYPDIKRGCTYPKSVEFYTDKGYIEKAIELL